MGVLVHVLQAGDDVEDIVAIAAVAAMDAHARVGGRRAHSITPNTAVRKL